VTNLSTRFDSLSGPLRRARLIHRWLWIPAGAVTALYLLTGISLLDHSLDVLMRLVGIRIPPSPAWGLVVATYACCVKWMHAMLRLYGQRASSQAKPTSRRNDLIRAFFGGAFVMFFLALACEIAGELLRAFIDYWFPLK